MGVAKWLVAKSATKAVRARSRRPLAYGLALTLASALHVSSSFASAQRPGDDDADPQDIERVTPRGFAIPETRQARALADRAAEHVAASRFVEAIADLQQLLLAHRGEVLQRRGANDGSLGDPGYRGAADWAREQLLELPARGRAQYRERYAIEAATALESARRGSERRTLVEVAVRYPLCDAARDAWWTLGDLELELGNLEAARGAWQRAADLASELGQPLDATARARLEHLLPTAGAPRVSALPVADSPSWRRRHDNNGRGAGITTPFGDPRAADPYVLQACLSGDTLLVCDSLRLQAFDAWSGAVRWTSPEVPGWDLVDAGKVKPNGSPRALTRGDFFQGLDERSLIVRPAAGAGIAVAALQIAVSQAYNKDFQNFTITTVIPDRRLFAFDIESGRELWNHLPPPMWDGEGGSFAERMSVAAPPVIAGSRLIVPAYRMQGRVDLHIACYDLFTGQLLWSTALISGQLELNMFGRPEREFCAAPAAIVGERVLMLTHLGAVVALDLATGYILWETLYEQIGIPTKDRMMQQDRAQYWTNTAPLVAECEGGPVLIATPLDSKYMLALDLERGTQLWRADVNKFVRTSRDNRLSLIDADAEGVWVAGTKVISARSPRGLRDAGGLIEFSESLELGENRAVPRPAATAEHVLFASQSRRIALDRRSLRREDRAASAEWTPDQSTGNVLAADGAVFFLNKRYVTAIVDFPAVERRYRERMQANPRDPRGALEYAELVRARGATLLEGPRIRDAAALLEVARTALQPLAQAHPELAAELFAILMLEARAANASADRATALARLEQARGIAPDDQRRVLVLLALHAQADGESDGARRESLLAELDACCSALPMPDDWWTRSGRARFAPEAGEDDGEQPIAVGQWVATERLHAAQAAGDVARELALAHELLARFADPRIPAREGAREPAIRASALIQTRLDGGAQALYEPFERSARELLERARAERSPELFERLARSYPHSLAAKEALDTQLHAALQAGDARTVANIALRRIPDDWYPAQARPEQVEGLLALADVLERGGNRELGRTLIESLARQHGALVSPLDDGGATLAQLAERARALDGSAHLQPATFSATPARAVTLLGRFDLIGQREFDLGDTREQLLIVAQRDTAARTLIAYDAATPDEPRWRAVLATDAARDALLGVCAERTILLLDRGQVQALDARDGQLTWNWHSTDERVEELLESSGVALLILRSNDGRARTLALDAVSGLELWTRATPRELWAKPVVGSSTLTLLPADYAATPARVLDLFTGSRVLDFATPEHVGESDLRGAWITGNTLVLPAFPKSSGAELHDCVSGWNLDTGKRTWRVAGDEQRVFDSIVRRGDDTYLIFLGGTDANRSGFVLELDTRVGAVRRLQNVAISENDVLIGVQRHHVTEIEGPYLLVRSSAPGEAETLLRGIHLPYGERWVHRMPIAASQFYNQGLMPLPELSDSTLALAYTASARKGASNSAPQTGLIYFNRDNGLLRNERPLTRELGGADSIELASLGAGLWVIGRDALLILIQ